MLRDTLFIARKDLQFTLGEKETLLWVFLMPIIFFYFIGTITSGFRGGTEKKDILAVTIAEDAGFLGDQVMSRLEDQGFEIIRTGTDEELQVYSRRLTIPAAFTDSVVAGNPVTLRFVHGEVGLTNSYDNVRYRQAIYTVLADFIVSREMGDEPSPEAFARLKEMPRALKLESKTAGKRKEIPGGFEQAIPGIMVMFTLLIMTTSGAVLLVVERKRGLLRRLAYTPIERTSVVVGKWSGKMATGIVQIAFAMVAGTVIFGMDWGPDLLMVLVIMVVYAANMASLGIILGSLARTDGQAAAIGVIASNILAALGGCWWPIEITPQWMQRLQLFLPTGWAMDALHRLISFASGPTDVIPHVIGMTAASLVLIAVASRVFRYE
jgi:ABC-type Na+ efflux pump permease subunit